MYGSKDDFERIVRRRGIHSTTMGPQTDVLAESTTLEEEYELQEFNDDLGSNGEVSKLLDKKCDELNGDYPGDEVVIYAPPEDSESFWIIFLQVFIPFLIAGLGMVAAGLVLDVVQHWRVFEEITEVFILVPALLGLKGNLEMTLASRLSTQANLGVMDTPGAKWNIAIGNLALIQCQAIVVGFLASVAAALFSWIPDGQFNFQHILLLCCGGIVTASLASFVLGVVMVLVVICSRRYNINPDNVATPIAASLGDLTTLTLLAYVCTFIYKTSGVNDWIPITIIIIYILVIAPICAVIARNNKFTKEVLMTGWTPVLSAMIISSVGGLILQATVSVFSGIAVFQPVINGVGGNLVAVQASRISTSLHRDGVPGFLPKYLSGICINPLQVFFAKTGHSKTSRVLMLAVIPGHLIFTYAISYLKAGHTSITPVFVAVYLTAAILQVAILLYIAQVLVQWMWTQHIDPDNSAIPYLTALGDLLGTGLLAVAFLVLYQIGDRDSDVGE